VYRESLASRELPVSKGQQARRACRERLELRERPVRPGLRVWLGRLGRRGFKASRGLPGHRECKEFKALQVLAASLARLAQQDRPALRDLCGEEPMSLR
jgi:hypothetical protein